MSKRLNYFELAPKAMTLLMQQEDMLHQCFTQSEKLSLAILELIKLRVSQINQCAFCIDMHNKDAIKLGETQERLYGLSAWRDMPFYSDYERSALEWAEHLTAGQPVSDTLYNRMEEALGQKELVDLTLAINAINSWNRISKVFKPALGSYSAY